MEPCGTNGNRALRFRGFDLVFFTELSVSMLKLDGSSDVGGWLPVCLAELSHWHGIILIMYDGAASISRRRRRNKKREIVWGP